MPHHQAAAVHGRRVNETDRGLVGLLSPLGHELRGPLTGILGLTRVMLVKLASGPVDMDRHIKQIELVQTSARQLLETVERVVAIAKLEAVAAHEPDRFDCRPVVSAAVDDARPAADDKHRAVVTDLPDEPVFVTGDPDALRRIVAELVDNAVKYTDHAEIRVRARQHRDRILVDVTDEGPGLADDEHDLIFEPFRRGSAAERNETTGSGLGLYLARKLATRTGADVFEQNSATGGTAFVVQFPNR